MLPRFVPAIAVLAVLLVAANPVPTITPTALPPGEGLRVPSTIEPAHAWVSLSVGGSAGTHDANPFFAVAYGETGNSATTHTNQGLFYNSTPITWYRLTGGGDGYDPTNQTSYIPPPSGVGHYVASPGELVNFTAFKSWCNSRTPRCEWLSYLPAEENNTTYAVHYAEWFHTVLNFAPTLWEFGNEPAGWTHYGINLTDWSTRDNSQPTNEDYATMVQDYITAVSAVYPHDKFVGIESSCACDPSFISETASEVGTQVVAMAYHDFPGSNASTTNLSQFYWALTTKSNITNSSAHFRSLIAPACPSCARLPVQLGAYQAGPSGNLSPFAATYAGAPFVAASVIQSLLSNQSMFTLFASGSLFNTTTGNISAQGYLYQRIFANMTMGTDYPIGFSTPSIGGLFGILIRNGTHQSMLLVNTNVSYGVGLGWLPSVFPVGVTGSIYAWSPLTSTPTVRSGVLLPKTLVLVSQGILLINNY
ncbi:MAG: hypothetical protein L3K17_04560 [Thermoplasmata archaeon]|nr:hypothetical protein [Thermoplasmata archaeon]